MTALRRLVGVGFGVSSALAASCQEPEVRPQWTVMVHTDAPLPLVGDRVLVEVLKADGTSACDACRSVRAAPPGTFPFSFGIVPTPLPLRVRVRLHRGRAVLDADTPDPETTLDALVQLPATPGPVHIDLTMACFGVPSQPGSSCDPATRALVPVAEARAGTGKLAEGSWALAQPGPCNGSLAPDGMRCAPAGPFFFGALLSADEPRDYLAYVSPFYLDIDEFSVGRARAAILAGAVAREPLRNTSQETRRCVYRGPRDDSNDDLALNCVDRALASAFCAAEGKTLPTEAQFAAAAGNGALGTRFPWGDSTDICAHAVVARSDDRSEPTECYGGGGVGRAVGPAQLGLDPRDLTLPPASFRNMGGDLDEWVQDGYLSLLDPYWRSTVPLVDPVAANPKLATTRGGAWFHNRAFAQAFWRASEGMAATPHTGFRCAKPASP